MKTAKMKELISDLQDFYILSVRGLSNIVKQPFYFKDTIEQMDYAGTGSLLIMLLVSLFIGMALSLHLSAELSALGLKMYTGMIVGISVIREVGPVTAALVFAGRVGAGMASELGSMILGHQVDTLRVFGVDPIKKLVTPRILSSIVMLPALTTIGDASSSASAACSRFRTAGESRRYTRRQQKGLLSGLSARGMGLPRIFQPARTCSSV